VSKRGSNARPAERTVGAGLAAALLGIALLGGCQSAPVPASAEGTTTTVGDTTITTGGRVRVETGYVGEP
jgi:hypothetical protein